MKRLLSQWLLCSVIVFLASLLLLHFFEETTFNVFETLLTPWLPICRALTPDSWPVERNILLGLMYFFSGAAVYSMLIGACLVGCRRILVRRS